MYNKEFLTPVMVYMPKCVLEKIDTDRKETSRSTFLVALTTMFYEELESIEREAGVNQNQESMVM